MSTSKSFAGKTALVFAASRGIGRATAIKLGAGGANVVVNYAINAGKAAEVVVDVESGGGKAIAEPGDVGDAIAVGHVFDKATDAFEAIDIVINAAGASAFGYLAELTSSDFERLVSVNIHGAFNVLSEAARRVRDGGSIVQFSTGGTKMAVPGGGAYAGSKAAGEQMALGLAKELGPRGVNVNVISPGVTNTDGLVMPEDQVQMLIQQTPMGRLGEPEDVADVAVFLVSPQAGWVTGQNLQANGGIL